MRADVPASDCSKKPSWVAHRFSKVVLSLLPGDGLLFFVCGGVEYSPSIGTMDQVPVLLENREGERFYRITPNPVLEKKEISRGCAVLD